MTRFAFRDDRGLRASITRRHEDRMPRTGSYPLMNIAQDYGVDYGDVLLAAMGYRAGFAANGLTLTEARWRDSMAALHRIDITIQERAGDAVEAIARWSAFGRALDDHVSQRWGWWQ